MALQDTFRLVRHVSQATLPAKEHLDTILDKYSDVFEDKLGTFKSAKAKLSLKEDPQAHFHKARAVPYALRPMVEEELRKLQNEGQYSHESRVE